MVRIAFFPPLSGAEPRLVERGCGKTSFNSASIVKAAILDRLGSVFAGQPRQLSRRVRQWSPAVFHGLREFIFGQRVQDVVFG